MRDTRSGKRTVVEVFSIRFSEAAALTSLEETPTGSPGCRDAKDDIPLLAVLEMGAEETSMEERAAAMLLLVCLAVIMARTTERQKKWNN